MVRFFTRNKRKTSKINPINSSSLEEQKSTSDPHSFTIIPIRHCQSCANVANPIGAFGGHTNKFWRQPLCTNKGVKQAIATGITLPKILQELQH